MLRYLFVDMNSYFASVEQQERPELRGRPVAVAATAVETTCCIAASYEAKRHGVSTGTAVHEARRLCPGLHLVEALARIERGRGWALEQAWRRLPDGFGRKRLDARWSDWIQRTAAGGQGVVFNAFDVDSGDRVLFSTVEIPGPGEAGALPKTRTLSDLADSGGPGPSPDVDVVTAARLSATFPYVAPIARPKPADGSAGLAAEPMYLADGGYFDSSGLMTAVDWIRALLRHEGGGYRERLGGIVLLEIRAFGNGEPAGQEGRAGRFGEAWIKAFGGPIEGMLSVRTAAQMARNRTAVGMLRDAHGPDFIHHLAFAPSGSGWPVSWHLSASDLRQLRAEKESAAFQSSKDRLIRLWSGRNGGH